MSEKDIGLVDGLDFGDAGDPPAADTRETVQVRQDSVPTNGKPEGIPDEFWDSKANKLNETALLEGYKAKDKQALDFRRIISKGDHKIPESIEGYKLELAEDVIPFVTPNDPAMQIYKKSALAAGISVDSFNKFINGSLVELKAANMIQVREPDLTPEQQLAEEKKYFDEEMKKLGDAGRVKFEEYNKIVGEAVRKGSLTPQDIEIYKDIMRSADHLRFIEKWNTIHASRPSSGLSVPNEHIVAEGELTREELQAMQADPRYQNEAGYKKIMDGYRKLEARNAL